MEYDFDFKFAQLGERVQKMMSEKLGRISNLDCCASCDEQIRGVLVKHHVDWSKGKNGYGKSNKNGPVMSLCANCHTLLHTRSILCMEYSREGAELYLESIESSPMIPEQQKLMMLDGYTVSYFVFDYLSRELDDFEHDLFTIAVLRGEVRTK